jgi:hypothetical protein
MNLESIAWLIEKAKEQGATVEQIRDAVERVLK